MTERIIDFSDVRVGDKVEIVRKTGGTRLIGDVTYRIDSEIRLGGDINVHKDYCQPEVMLLNRKERDFEPGIYVSHDYADTPWNAIIWVLDGGGKWKDLSDFRSFSHPSDAYDDWEDSIVRFIPEVDAE